MGRGKLWQHLWKDMFAGTETRKPGLRKFKLTRDFVSAHDAVELIDLQRYVKIRNRKKLGTMMRNRKAEPFIFLVHLN